MSNYKHTPGPWYCDKQPKGAFKITQHGDAHPRPGHIATVGSANLVPIAQEEATANAKLIAAAPELLAFAIQMQAYFVNNPNGYEGMREMCNAAITKATPSK